VGFFPRHILVGYIYSFLKHRFALIILIEIVVLAVLELFSSKLGLFFFFNILFFYLISSRFSLTVSLRISDDDFNMTWETFRFTFLDGHNLLLWTIPLFLAILLRFITHKYHHQLIFPLCVYSFFYFDFRWKTTIFILTWYRFPRYSNGFLCCRRCQKAGFE
jgi:hypothetical protein